MECHIWAAGAESGTMRLNIPVYRGVPLTPEASLRWDDVSRSSSLEAQLGGRMDTRHFEFVRVEVEVRALDSLNLNPAFVKLDVQGFEGEALAGLVTTLRRSQPVLLVEAPDQAARSLLSDLGYEAFSYLAEKNRLVPEISGRANTVFVPEAVDRGGTEASGPAGID